MPKPEKRRGREVQFTRTVKIDKRQTDPFGAREQAIGLAKRRARLPKRPNVDRLAFEARDAGDHWEVTVRGLREEAGPPAIAGERSGGRAGGFGPGGPDGKPGRPDMEGSRGGGFAQGVGLGFSSGGSGGGWLGFSGPDAGGDLPGRLEALMGINELRAELSDLGHRPPQTASKSELARLLAEREPARARGLAGW